jgi:hypothetical protein
MSAGELIKELQCLADDTRRLAASLDDPIMADRLIKRADETLTLIGSWVDDWLP